MQKYLFILLAIIALSCKEDSKKNVEADIIKEVVPKETPTLNVIMNAIVIQDDVFEVYFYEEGQERFDSKDFVPVKVKGSDKAQDIIFKLPEYVEPIRLRIDIGRSTKQKDIKLNDVKLTYKDNSYVFDGEKFSKMFKHNKFVDFNQEDLIIKTKVIDGKYDPYFLSHSIGGVVKSVMRQPESNPQ